MTQLLSVETERKEAITSLTSRLESTEAALMTARESVSSLQAQLNAKNDYDVIKRELEVLRSIEFQQQAGEAPLMMDEPLEFRLRRKNEQLQNRIASISAEKDEIECKLFKSEQVLFFILLFTWF